MLIERLRTLFQLQRGAGPGAPGELRPVIDEVAVAWPFSDAAIDLSHDGAGVYLLYATGRLIYIGVALPGSSIRRELACHLRGARGACTGRATAFMFEPTLDPEALQGKYFAQHRARYGGRLPSCNSAPGA
jgi:hypothetical protein